MSYFRRTLLAGLVLLAVVTALTGYVGRSSASSLVGPLDPAWSSPPPTQMGPPLPNTGEPDAGSTRSQSTNPKTVVPYRPIVARTPLHALQMIRWTSIVWAKSILGIGE